MLRPVGTNISVITNFGCRANCWYCIWKDHPLKDIHLETDWLKLETFLVENQHKGKVSVSGGGDCLYRYDDYTEWWENLFGLCSALDMLVDVHSREPFYNGYFWQKVNRVVVSSDRLEKDCDYLEWLLPRVKLRVVHVVTVQTTAEVIEDYLDFQQATDCQFTLKQLSGHDDCGNYQKFSAQYPETFQLDEGDYNLYYMPDNTVTDNFMLEAENDAYSQT